MPRKSGLKDPFLRHQSHISIELQPLQSLPYERTLSPQDYLHQINRISDEYLPRQQGFKVSRLFDSYGLFMDSMFQTIKLQSNYLLIWNLVNWVAIFVLFNQSLFSVFIISVAKDHKHIDLSGATTLKTVLFYLLLLDTFVVRYKVRVVVDGRMVLTHGNLLKRYLTKLFLLDLMALIITLIDLLGIDIVYGKLLFVCKVKSLLEIDGQIFYKLMGHQGVILFIKFIRVCFIIAYFTFFFACGFVYIELMYLYQGGYYQQYQFLWITSSPKLFYVNVYEAFDWPAWFLYALFMVMQMCTGCGYGMPYPQTPLGCLWYNISTLTTRIAFGYFTSRVADIFTDLFHNKDYLSTTMIQLSLLQRQHKSAPKDFFEGLSKYINRTQLSREHDIGKVQKQFPSFLSTQLVPEFRYSYKKHFLMRLHLLSILTDRQEENEVNQFYQDLSEIIRTKTLLQKEVLFQRNQINKEILYLCELKIIQVRVNSLDHNQLEREWAWVGVREFFISKQSLFTVSAVRPGLVEYINKEDFIKVLKGYPHIYMKYCEHLDLIKHNRATTKYLELKCWRCEGFHLPEHCHFFKTGSVKLKGRKRVESQEEGQSREQCQRRRELQGKVVNWKIYEWSLDCYCQSEEYFNDGNLPF